LKSITSMEEMAYRIPETILEGLAKNPKDFVILGLGFFLGWEGLDIFGAISKGFINSVMGAAKGTAALPLDLSKSILDTANIPPSMLKFIFAPAMLLFGKPSGTISKAHFEDISVLRMTQEELDAQAAKTGTTDPALAFQINWTDIEMHLITGCLGALTAYALTRPGAIGEIIAGVGDIVKGIGEIVPL